MGKYDEYIGRDRPESEKYGKKKRQDRAKQFAPFAAVKGHAAAVRAKERVIVPRSILCEDAAEDIDKTLGKLQRGDMVAAVCYAQGRYVKITGRVSKIDPAAGRIRIVNQDIPIENLFQIHIEE